MNKRKAAIWVLGLLLLLAAAGILTATLLENDQELKELKLYGNVDIREVDLAFDAHGRIEDLTAHEGDKVSKGQELAYLDNRKLKLQLKQQQAQIRMQEQVVTELEEGSRQQEIDRARAELNLAQAKAENAKQTYDRIKELAAREIVTEQDRDDAYAELKVARESVNAARETLNLLLAGPREEKIRAQQAKLDAYEAAADLLQEQINDTVLKAPVHGTIRNRLLEPGDMASPQKPVYTIALHHPIWVRAYVSETNLGRIKPGMNAYITTDTYPEKRYEGRVGFISPTAEFTPKNVHTPEMRTNLVYQVRVNLRQPTDELRLGMPATVVIPLPHDNNNKAETDE